MRNTGPPGHEDTKQSWIRRALTWRLCSSSAWFSLTAVILSLIGFSQQPAGGPLKAGVRAHDWDISSWGAVRMGRLGVVRQAGADELRIYSLLTATPPPPGRIRSLTPACDGNCLQISSYDEGSRNLLGGYYSAFQALPSTARAALAVWDDGRRALTLDFSKAGSGYCGLWIHLFDSQLPAADRIYLNASPFSVLTFWVRGQTGSERVLLKISDASWDRKEDALPVGDVGSYLPNGRIEGVWRQAVIPLNALPRDIDTRQLATLVLEGTGGMGRVAVKDAAFCIRRESLPALSAPQKPGRVARAPEKTLWVWNTAEILTRDAEQAALVDLCRRRGIAQVLLQIPKEGDMLLQPERWKAFLALLSRNRVKAAALDGAKEYALPEWHQRVLMTVDNIVRYNRSVDPEQRFAGVHYDIEPYLLPGFQGMARQRIMHAYLELLEKISSRVRAAGMTFGADIPFWYDAPDELTRQYYTIEYGGARKPADEHIIDLVDQVVIMDYRTSAYGANGLLALSEGELAYAEKTGKKLLIGLETTDLPDEDLIDFDGAPSRGFRAQLPGTQVVVLEPDPAGDAIWLVRPAQWEEFTRGLRARGTDVRSLIWPVRRISAVPATRLTFCRLGAAVLDQTMGEALDEMSRRPAFAGFAIHDYLGYRKLLEQTSGK